MEDKEEGGGDSEAMGDQCVEDSVEGEGDEAVEYQSGIWTGGREDLHINTEGAVDCGEEGCDNQVWVNLPGGVVDDRVFCDFVG